MLADLSIPWNSTLPLAFHLLGGFLIFVATPPAGSSDSVKATVQDTVYVHPLQERLTLAGKLPDIARLAEQIADLQRVISETVHRHEGS